MERFNPPKELAIGNLWIFSNYVMQTVPNLEHPVGQLHKMHPRCFCSAVNNAILISCQLRGCLGSQYITLWACKLYEVHIVSWLSWKPHARRSHEDIFCLNKMGCRDCLRGITVEPLALLYCLCQVWAPRHYSWFVFHHPTFSIQGIPLLIVQEMYIEKTCSVNLNYSMEICSNLTSGNYSEIQAEVHKHVSTLQSINGILQVCLSNFLYYIN